MESMKSDDVDDTIVNESDEEEFDEAKFLEHVRLNRWVSMDVAGMRLFRFNWVVSLMASVVLWGFAIACLIEPDDTLSEFKKWQVWITQNFTWLYIGTQDVWSIFLLWLCFSKYGTIKLGKKNDKPEYNDFTWFAMLFSCGIAVGLYYYGVSEPMYYYRNSAAGSNMFRTPVSNDDEQAQQAIFITLYHWGIHAWVVYIIVALLLGFMSYRWNLPMTIRMAFYPLVGEHVYGFLGDFIDAGSMACTTFGVCTSLGFGVSSINAGISRLNSDIPADDTDWQVALIWIITPAATLSVISGVNYGIKTISELCFIMGCFLILAIFFLDNSWFILNSLVQSIGHYFQWILQVGFHCDTWAQLNLEFQDAYQWRGGGEGKEYWDWKKNQLWEAGADKLWEPVTDIVGGGNILNGSVAGDTVTSTYNSGPDQWIDWWTIFYWGWWISWAPFVGTFIAKISRGRTIRQVIVGAMFAPVGYSFMFLVTLGSLGIKMERTAELALAPNATAIDWAGGVVDCSMLGYADGVPVREDAKELADIGIYALACRAHTGRIYDLVDKQYGENMGTFLTLFIVTNLIIYFITSSDSGSWVDDSLSANGHPHPPVIQKVYWCCTEGAVATALLVAGGSNSLSALQ
eukprot:gene17014-20227_t